MPKNIANRVCCQPKNSPAAAINLMSPPPNAPGIARQSSSIGTLMHTMPMSAPAHRAGESSSAFYETISDTLTMLLRGGAQT